MTFDFRWINKQFRYSAKEVTFHYIASQAISHRLQTQGTQRSGPPWNCVGATIYVDYEMNELDSFVLGGYTHQISNFCAVWQCSYELFGIFFYRIATFINFSCVGQCKSALLSTTHFLFTGMLLAWVATPDAPWFYAKANCSMRRTLYSSRRLTLAELI